MKYSISKQCTIVYKTIQQKIADEWAEQVGEQQWIERAFGITVQAWSRLEQKVKAYRFLDQHEEIYFYKILRPQFTGLIDYFTLLYRSVLFLPDDCTKQRTYWRNELKHCKEFLARYKKLGSHFEDLHFSCNDQQPHVFGININYLNFTATSPGYLLARVIAIKKYQQYIQDSKLN